MTTVNSTGDISSLLQIDQSFNDALGNAMADQLANADTTLYWAAIDMFGYGMYTPIELTDSNFTAYIDDYHVHGYVSGLGSGFLGSSGTISEFSYDGDEYNWRISGNLNWSSSYGIHSGTITNLELWNESNTEHFTISCNIKIGLYGATGNITSVEAEYNGITFQQDRIVSLSSAYTGKTTYLAYGDTQGNQISIADSLALTDYVTKLSDLFDHPELFTGNDTFNVDDDSRAWFGFAGGDLMTGGDRANEFHGGSGSDKLYGLGGGDTLYGDEGNDYLNGGTSADTLLGGLGNDTYFVDDVGDQVVEYSGQGSDTVLTSIDHTLADNVEYLVLTGSDALSGTGNVLNNRITGNDGENTLDGAGGVDLLRGGLGDDTYLVDLIQKGTGSTASVALQDRVSEATAAGNDTLLLRGELAEVTRTTTLTLGANLENLDASQTSFTRLNLKGNVLDNRLIGNDADNLLDGRAGSDSFSGGLGNDTYVLDQQSELAQISEDADAGNDTLRIAYRNSLASALLVDLGAPGLNQVENVTLAGSGLFDLYGNALDNALTGNASVNVLSGGAGNDILDGKAGADILQGGLGDDTYVVDNLKDVVSEAPGEGIDTVRASISWTLASDLENLTLTGGSAIAGTGNELDNILTGNTAANRLDGGSGADTLIGGLGNDTYLVDNAGDQVVEFSGQGTDTVRAAIDYTLTDNVEYLVLTGSANLSGTGNALNNILTGNDGDNTLDGAAGVDQLRGGKGDDTYLIDLIQKGTGSTATVGLQDTVSEATAAGNDTLLLRGELAEVTRTTTLTLGANLENLDASQTGLTRLNLTGNTLDNQLIGNDADNLLNGGAGNDSLSSGHGADVLIGGLGTDMLEGGTGADVFRFTSLAEMGLGDTQDVVADFENGVDKLDLSTLGGYSFVADAEFSASKQLRIDVVGDDLILYGNSDSNPATAEFSIKLSGISTLNASDLIL